MPWGRTGSSALDCQTRLESLRSDLHCRSLTTVTRVEGLGFPSTVSAAAPSIKPSWEYSRYSVPKALVSLSLYFSCAPPSNVLWLEACYLLTVCRCTCTQERCGGLARKRHWFPAASSSDDDEEDDARRRKVMFLSASINTATATTASSSSSITPGRHHRQQ